MGLMWMLAREVLRMPGTISHTHLWELMRDLYIYRDPEEIEKEEKAAAEKAVMKEELQGGWTALTAKFTAAQPEVAALSEGAGALYAFSAACSSRWSAQSPLKTPLQPSPLRPLSG